MTEQPQQSSLSKLYRAAIGLYILCLIALLGAYFGVALLDVNYSIYIQGPPTLIAGQPQSIRGVLMSAQTGQTIIKPHQLRLGILPADQDKPLRELAREPDKLIQAIQPALRYELPLTPEPSGIFHAALAPDLAPGDYTLVSIARIKDDDDLFIAHAPITLAPAPAPPTPTAKWPTYISRKSEDSATTTKPGIFEAKGPIRIEVIPHQPEVIRGLPDTLFIRTVDALSGEPVACELELGGLRGLVEQPLPKTLRTDSLGLTKLPITAVLALSFTLKTSCQAPSATLPSAPAPDPTAPPTEAPASTSSAQLHLETVASQLSMTLPSPLAKPGATIDATAISLQSSGPLFVHAINQGKLTDAATFGLNPGISGMRVSAPSTPGAEPIVRVQAYLDMYLRGRAWDERVIAVGDDALTPLQYLLTRHSANLQDQPQGPSWAYLRDHPELYAHAPERQQRTLLEAALRQVPPHFIDPEPMLNSLSGDKARLEARKQQGRAQLIVLIVIALLVGLIALGLAVYQGIQEARRRQRLLDELELELEGTEAAAYQVEAAFDTSATRTRRAAIAQGVVILGTLVIFGALLIMLLRFL